MKITLRELFLLILVAAVALAWWVDRSRFTRQQAILQRMIPPETMEPVMIAWEKSNRKFLLRRIMHHEGDEITVGFGWGTPSVGAGETIRLKKVGNTWEVVEQEEYDV